MVDQDEALALLIDDERNARVVDRVEEEIVGFVVDMKRKGIVLDCQSVDDRVERRVLGEVIGRAVASKADVQLDSVGVGTSRGTRRNATHTHTAQSDSTGSRSEENYLVSAVGTDETVLDGDTVDFFFHRLEYALVRPRSRRLSLAEVRSTRTSMLLSRLIGWPQSKAMICK